MRVLRFTGKEDEVGHLHRRPRVSKFSKDTWVSEAIQVEISSRRTSSLNCPLEEHDWQDRFHRTRLMSDKPVLSVIHISPVSKSYLPAAIRFCAAVVEDRHKFRRAARNSFAKRFTTDLDLLVHCGNLDLHAPLQKGKESGKPTEVQSKHEPP